MSAPSDEQQPDGENKSVFVGNLSYQTSWQDLKDHMKTSGHDVARVDILMSNNGRSKGCGVVEFVTAEGAQAAIETLNQSELNGREIYLREGENRPAGGRSGGRQQQSGGSSRFATGEKAQSRRVYVGNCAWTVAWQDLKDHMRQAGEVVHAEIICEHGGRSKGCGIVEYLTEEGAKEAIQTLNDTELNGRMIFVREDRETAGAAGVGGGGGGGGPNRGGHQQNTSVYVWGLDDGTTWQDLKDHMRKAGNVDQVTILKDSDGKSIGCATVVYQKPHEASRAIQELEGSIVDNCEMHLREDRAQGRGQGGGRGGRRGHRGGYGGGGGGEDCQIYVGNISDDTDWRNLKDHFGQCGRVDRADVKYSERTATSFGIVRFFNKSDAETAIATMDGVELKGSALEVRLDKR